MRPILCVFTDDFTHQIDAPIAVCNRSAVWGGASKGVIFTLLKARAGYAVDAVIDINPAKQGRFLAATGLRVQSPENGLARLKPGDDVYVMSRNYLDEIPAAPADQFNYRMVEHEQI